MNYFPENLFLFFVSQFFGIKAHKKIICRYISPELNHEINPKPLIELKKIFVFFWSAFDHLNNGPPKK